MKLKKKKCQTAGWIQATPEPTQSPKESGRRAPPSGEGRECSRQPPASRTGSHSTYQGRAFLHPEPSSPLRQGQTEP